MRRAASSRRRRPDASSADRGLKNDKSVKTTDLPCNTATPRRLTAEASAPRQPAICLFRRYRPANRAVLRRPDRAVRKDEQPKPDRTHRRGQGRKSCRSVILQTDECVFLKINAYICRTRRSRRTRRCRRTKTATACGFRRIGQREAPAPARNPNLTREWDSTH